MLIHCGSLILCRPRLEFDHSWYFSSRIGYNLKYSILAVVRRSGYVDCINGYYNINVFVCRIGYREIVVYGVGYAVSVAANYSFSYIRLRMTVFCSVLWW